MSAADLILRASAFAAAAHAAVGQTRKWTLEPYIVHPRAVAKIVQTVTDDAAMIAAALLHDVVEDTKVDIGLIRELFGIDVAELVSWLTDPKGSDSRNARITAKAANIDRLAQAPARAQTIKVADVIDNTSTIVDRDPAFAAGYLAEKRALLEVLTLADPVLLARAREQCMEAVA